MKNGIKLDFTQPVLMVVDSGKFNVKGQCKSIDGEDVQLVFRTTLAETSKMMPEYQVIYDYRSYSIGDPSIAIETDTHLVTEKDSPLHLLTTLKMIAELIKEGGYIKEGLKIQLGINVPVKQYLKGTKEVEKITKMYKGEHEIVVNKEKYSFEIVDVQPYFEGSGVLYNNLAKYKNSRLVIVDNGGLNSTYVPCVDLRPQGSAGSLTSGVHSLVLTIQTELSDYGLNSEQILDILEGRTERTNASPKVIEDIKECLAKHVTDIHRFLNNFSRTNVTKYVFTGGTSDIYREELEKRFEFCEFSENGLYDNVSGFYKFLSAKNKRQ